MVVSEEIEALEAHAINPIRFLVVPRVLATTIMMICIAILGDVAGIIGGLSVGQPLLGIGYNQYVTHTFDILKLKDFIGGLVKAGVFGALIAGQACYLGLGVTGGRKASAGPRRERLSTPLSLLITVDLVFTSVFYFIGF